jgi:hypothetical protein
MGKESTERREHKRYTYKPESYPTFDCQTARYRVVNISEGGLKIKVLSNPDRPVESTSFLNGVLCFSNGNQVHVSGRLVWIIGNEIGIKLNQPISQELISNEMKNFQSTE